MDRRTQQLREARTPANRDAALQQVRKSTAGKLGESIATDGFRPLFGKLEVQRRVETPNGTTFVDGRLADDLRDFVESLESSALKLDDEDRAASRRGIEEQGTHNLAGSIFWTRNEIRQAQETLEKMPEFALPAGTLASWLDTQARRGRAVILLAR